MFRELSHVRVKNLLRSANEYDGWNINKRPPQIGDIGVIVDIQHGPNMPINYVVECCNSNEGTVWLCDLNFEEIEVM
jgi:hypothetical protein